jgi:hypothetical protein
VNARDNKRKRFGVKITGFPESRPAEEQGIRWKNGKNIHYFS